MEMLSLQYNSVINSTQTIELIGTGKVHLT